MLSRWAEYEDQCDRGEYKITVINQVEPRMRWVVTKSLPLSQSTR